MNPFDAPRPAHEANATAQVCDHCGSRVAGLCQPLDAAALDEISSEAQQLTLPAHSAVFREGDPAGRVFTLIDGVAKLSRLLPDGKQQVVGFRFAGDVIGYTTLKNYPFDAELLTDAKICRLDRGQPRQVLDMPMTRADIADFLGLTLETVSRSLTAFRKRGWIREPVHHRVELLDVPAITALAEGTSDRF